MIQKLKCVIVDDDAASMNMLSDFCIDVPYVDITAKFQDSMKFIELLPTLDFDVCIVNLNMPRMNGIKIAQQLNGKPVIFVAGGDRMLRDAINMAPVDIVLKPLRKEKIIIAIEKAYSLLENKRRIVKKIDLSGKEYGFFHVAGEAGTVRIRLSDILLVITDEKDPRNKNITMRDGETYTLKKCKFDDLYDMAPNHLVRVNKNHMVAVELVQKYEHDLITLDYPAHENCIKQITLARTYKDQFKRQLAAC